MQQFDFTQFHYLVMDASFFLHPLKDDLCAELSKHCNPRKMPFLCASSTFHSEFRQYAQLLEACPDKLSLYLENLKKLKDHNVSLYIHSYRDYGNPDHTPRHDTWSLLDHLLHMNTGPVKPRILLLTGNELLLRRVALNGLPVSIYDLRKETLFTPEELAKKKEEYELDLQEDPIELRVSKTFVRDAELILYDAPEGGEPVRLIYNLRRTDGVITDAYTGTEGEFFSVEGKPELVAKIYGKDMGRPFSQQLAQNIQNMHRFHTLGLFPWAVLPEALLYDTDGNVAGYMMKKLDKSCLTLQEQSRFNNSPTGLDSNENTPYAETLRICLSILREIAYMSNFDILPLDFGRGNFCPSKDDPRYVYLLDTCSVCFNRFFSSKRDPDLEPQYIDLTKGISSKLELIDLYMELVHLFMLSLMTLGSALGPMPREDGTPILNFLLTGDERARFDTLVPNNLRQLYWDLFCDPKKQVSPFSVEVLMEELSYALEVVEQTAPTYGSLVKDKGHQGDAYPSEAQQNVLPSVYGADVLITLPKEEHVTVYERPAYLQVKEPPKVHTFNKLPVYTEQPAAPGRAESEPLPPVAVTTPKPRIKRTTILIVLLALSLMVCIDFLCFAGMELGFTLQEFWTVRMDTLRDFWTWLTEAVSGWIDSLSKLLSNK